MTLILSDRTLMSEQQRATSGEFSPIHPDSALVRFGHLSELHISFETIHDLCIRVQWCRHFNGKSSLAIKAGTAGIQSLVNLAICLDTLSYPNSLASNVSWDLKSSQRLLTPFLIRRLARRGGVKRISGQIYEDIRGAITTFLKGVSQYRCTPNNQPGNNILCR